MTGAVDRMIARARAPETRVRPLLPSRYEPDGYLGAGDAAWTPEDVRESSAAASGGPALGVRSDGPVEIGGPRPRREEPAFPDAGRDAARHPVERPAAERQAAERPASAPPAVPVSRDAPSVPRPVGTARAAPSVLAPSNATDAPPASGRAERETVPPPVAAPRAEARAQEERVIAERPTDPRPAPRPERPAGGTTRERAAAAAEVRLGTTEVSISIGHIEVRAAPAPEPRRPRAPRPHVTLEEFLRRHDRSGR